MAAIIYDSVLGSKCGTSLRKTAPILAVPSFFPPWQISRARLHIRHNLKGTSEIPRSTFRTTKFFPSSRTTCVCALICPSCWACVTSSNRTFPIIRILLRVSPWPMRPELRTPCSPTPCSAEALEFSTTGSLILCSRTAFSTADRPSSRSFTLALCLARPIPNFVSIDQFEASGSSQSNGLTVTYKGTVHKLNVMAQYVLSRTLDDVTDSRPGVNGFLYTPANNYDPHGDWGRSDLDRRHRFNMVLVYPWRFGFQVSGIVNAWSGLP